MMTGNFANTVCAHWPGPKTLGMQVDPAAFLQQRPRLRAVDLDDRPAGGQVHDRRLPSRDRPPQAADQIRRETARSRDEPFVGAEPQLRSAPIFATRFGVSGSGTPSR